MYQPYRWTNRIGKDISSHGLTWGDALHPYWPEFRRQAASSGWRSVPRPRVLGTERHYSCTFNYTISETQLMTIIQGNILFGSEYDEERYNAGECFIPIP